MENDLQPHFTARGEIKARFWSSDKAGRVLLAIAGLLGFIPSANELWLRNEEGFFTRFTSFGGAITFACVFAFLLFIFYCMNWYRITSQAISGSMLAYALISAVLDILVMTVVVFGVYFAVGEITLETFNSSWKLLYIVVPLAIGEFALTSIVTRLLRKAAEIERDLQDSEETFRKLVERSKRSELKPTSHGKKSEVIAKFLGEDSESGESIDNEQDENQDG